MTLPAMPALVPELLVSDLKLSLAFWCDLIGFQIDYERPEEKFAYLVLGNAHIMLEQAVTDGRYWVTGNLEHPRGRGINFQIEVKSVDEILERFQSTNTAIYMAVEEKWYRENDREHGNRQFLVQDPDGYLLRLFEDLGERVAK